MQRYDYYAILGIPRNANDEEIKRAYRQLVREWHPDLHPDMPDAKQRIVVLIEARDVLLNPVSRRLYDLDKGIESKYLSKEPCRPSTLHTIAERRSMSFIPLLVTSAMFIIVLFAAIYCMDKPQPDRVPSLSTANIDYKSARPATSKGSVIYIDSSDLPVGYSDSPAANSNVEANRLQTDMISDQSIFNKPTK